MAVRIASRMSSSSKEQLLHSVSQFLQPRPVRMEMQWVRERYSLRSLAPGRHVLSLHPQTVVFAHLVGTNSSSSTGQPRLCHSGSALGAIPASLATGLTCRDSLNPASNLWDTRSLFLSSLLSGLGNDIPSLNCCSEGSQFCLDN